MAVPRRRKEAFIFGLLWTCMVSLIRTLERLCVNSAGRMFCTICNIRVNKLNGYRINNGGSSMELYNEAIRNKPYVADEHYDCARRYEMSGYYFEAFEQYAIAQELMLGGNPHQFSKEEVQERIELALEKIEEYMEEGTDDIVLAKTKKAWLDYIAMQSRCRWGISYDVFHSDYEIITKEYMDYVNLPKLYVGYAQGIRNDYYLKQKGALKDSIFALSKSTYDTRAELQRIYFTGKEVTITWDCEYFLPVVMESSEILVIENNGKSFNVSHSGEKQFVNYRMPAGESRMYSKSEFRIGEIIPITHAPERKRLVLNIFVDGLSQIVQQENFANLMPHTYRFFQKGIVCNNVYTAGDWTYPSIASIVTGQTMAEHKMLHSKLKRRLDIDTPILFEYFKAAGYNTSKIGGNWRITPGYGYARGMDRVFYQNHYVGYPVEDIVSDVIEQIHGMRETDQFIWMEIGELHQIADGLGLEGLLKEFPISSIQEIKKDINSVKQTYNPMKIQLYLKEIEKVDRKLAALYQYIEEYYAEDEVVVSLFSDHGQGYLLKQEDEFLGDGRSKVAFMVRNGELSGQTDEVISTCDYTAILCKLAGIEYSYDNTDAHLPCTFGGVDEREFAISESIHVGDPYQISLKGKDFVFYLEGKEDVTSECRVPLEDYTVKLLDKEEVNTIEDKDRIEYYTAYCLKHIDSCVIKNELGN